VISKEVDVHVSTHRPVDVRNHWVDKHIKQMVLAFVQYPLHVESQSMGNRNSHTLA
jgi:hypothetical protein